VTEDLISKNAAELLQLIKTRAVRSIEIVEAYLRRIERLNPSLNAVVTIAPDVLDRARERDAELAGGSAVGPLHGLPITVKDTIDTANIRTTRGSRLFADHVPVADAVAVARLKAAGCIVLGKTNVPEMAIPYQTDNLLFGRTNNPHDVSRTAGGSSGGEAAAIGAKLSPAGIGSDLSGSIRVPAHFCGIAGLKPTTGAVPMKGHVPQATGTLSLGAVIGPMARRVWDLALLFRVIADRRETEFQDQESDLRGTNFACYTGDESAPVQDDIANALGRAAIILKEAGLRVVNEGPPVFSQALRLWIELFSRAANQQICELYRGREAEAGPAVSALFRSRRQATFEEKINTAETLAAAVVERERLREQLLRWMKAMPLILAPVSATVAFPHGASRVEVRGTSISVFHSCGYSQLANVFGLPAVVVPVARTAAGMPIGVQLIGRPWAEQQLLAAAAIIERETGF
jgi:Asp-tRNA(Asn)/Glu-tRNA(Gln) amidotransferase A subunit family amidase